MDVSFLNKQISDNPLISVLIPVFNTEQYLCQCLESVVRQTYTNIEIILIDDGSTDNSGSICDSYAKQDARIRVIHTGNRGIATARNHGLELAKGSYIVFLDSDDWMELHSIETLLSKAVQTGADIVVTGCFTEFKGKSLPSGHREEQILYKNDILSAYAKEILRDIVWNKLYRKECFADVVFPDGHTYEDVKTTHKLLTDVVMKNGKIAIISEDLYHYRMRKSSIVHTKTVDHIIDSWEAYYGKYSLMTEHSQQLVANCYTIIGQMWINYHRFSRENRRKAYPHIVEMHAFSKKHYTLVVRGNYPLSIKLVCIMTQIKNTPALWLFGIGGQILQRLNRNKDQLYD